VVTVSIESVIGANQKYEKYSARMKAEFNERTFFDKDYRTMPMERSHKAVSTRWAMHHPGAGEFVPWTPFLAREQRG
jgi:hypothetical protein